MHQTCKVPTFQPIRVVRYPARRPIPRAQSSLGDSDRSTSALGAVDLPYGVLWWSDRTHNVYQHDVLHGSRPGGPGLVLARQISSVQIVDQEERQRVSIQAFQAKSDTNLHLATTDTITFDITDYALVDEPSTKQLADGLAAQLYPPTNCTGVVLVSQERHEQTDQVCKMLLYDCHSGFDTLWLMARRPLSRCKTPTVGAPKR